MPWSLRRALAAVWVVAALGACSPNEPETRTPSPPPTPSAACSVQALQPPARTAGSFDGGAALAWVDAIVNDGGQLRPRAPGAPCREGTVDWLERAMSHPGWTVKRQSFTGADYLTLSLGAAASFANACPPSDRGELPKHRFTNLWALRPGTRTDLTLLIGAHWDAKEDAREGGVVPAANDGASGMGLLLELMRALEAERVVLPFNLVVAFFDGEDGFNDCHPLAGSLYFAQHLPVPIDRMLLLDMVGDEDARFLYESASVTADPELVKLIWTKAKSHGLGKNFTRFENEILDDHRPFIEVGIPAVDIIDNARNTPTRFPPYWHTREDTVDKLSAAMLDRMGELLLDVMQDPSFTALWPQPRRSKR